MEWKAGSSALLRRCSQSEARWLTAPLLGSLQPATQACSIPLPSNPGNTTPHTSPYLHSQVGVFAAFVPDLLSFCTHSWFYCMLSVSACSLRSLRTCEQEAKGCTCMLFIGKGNYSDYSPFWKLAYCALPRTLCISSGRYCNVLLN